MISLCLASAHVIINLPVNEYSNCLFGWFIETIIFVGFLGLRISMVLFKVNSWSTLYIKVVTSEKGLVNGIVADPPILTNTGPFGVGGIHSAYNK